MSKRLLFLAAGTLFFACAGYSEESSQKTEDESLDVAKISEAMGHLIGKNLQELGLSIDLASVVKGMQDAAAGKAPPLSEDQCVQAISLLQEENLSAAAEKNLSDAESFLEKNAKEEGIVAIEEGKIQYRITKKGDGAPVQTYNSPLLHYSVRVLNGSILGQSNEDEVVSLDETIPGFAKGVVGMKEGETRTLFVHPDLGYGKQNSPNPNSLLIFEISVTKADAAAEAHAASNSDILPQNLKDLEKAIDQAESLQPR